MAAKNKTTDSMPELINYENNERYVIRGDISRNNFMGLADGFTNVKNDWAWPIEGDCLTYFVS